MPTTRITNNSLAANAALNNLNAGANITLTKQVNITNAQSISGNVSVQATGANQNLQEWKNTSGSTLIAVTSAGRVNIGSTINPIDVGSNNLMSIAGTATNGTLLFVRGSAGGGGSIFQALNNSNVGLRISETGQMYAPANASFSSSGGATISYGGINNTNVFSTSNAGSHPVTDFVFRAGTADRTAGRLFQVQNFTLPVFTIAASVSSGNVGIGTSTPDSTAVLELSSTTRGFLPPRMTTAERDAIVSPPNGLEIYNTTTNKPNVRSAGAWIEVAAGLGTGVAEFLASPTSDNLRAAVTGETGTEALVFANAPTITSPTIAGTPSFPYVLTLTNEIALRDIFATGGITSGTIGDLRWNMGGAGSAVAYIGQALGSFGLVNTNAITSALATNTIYLNNQGYSGSGFFSRSTTTPFQMVASISSGYNATRNRSVAFCFVSQPSGNMPTIQTATPANSFGVRYIMPSQAAWTASTAYVVGYNARPTTANGLKYICTTAGTSGSTEPTWPTTVGTTVADGTAVWTCAGADGNASHLFEFYVTGANPLVNITTVNSTVVMPSATRQFVSISIRASSTGIHFSVNNETEQFIATTDFFTGTPAFISRNDNSATFGNSLFPIRYFGFYAASKL